MRDSYLALILISLIVSGCGGGKARSKPASVQLPPDVYIIPAEYMRAFCTILDQDGNVLHEEKPCPDYRTPPVDVIARFEMRLPALLEAKGDHLPKLNEYVRQYWGVFRDGRLHVNGQLVCRTHAVHFPGPPQDYDEQEPIPPERLAQGPLIIDDAGNCLLSLSFPADQPEAIDF